MKAFALGVVLCSTLVIAGLMSYVLCFEATMFGGYVPFAMLSLICPLATFTVGYALRGE